MSVTKLAILRGGFRMLLLVGLAAGMAVLARAQADAPPAPPPLPPPPGAGMMMRGPGLMGDGMHFGIGEGKQVKGAPMSAELVVTRDTTLANGTHIHNVSTTKVYRDSEGRVRREICVDLNTTATGAVKRNMIVLADPVSGNRYLLNPDNKTARQMPVREGKHKEHVSGGPGDAPLAPGAKFDDPANVKSESLGTKTIGGLQAEGTRVTRTIPAGQIGNDQAILVVSERWVSTELQVPLLIIHSDPMMGEVTSTLTNITRAEPDATLFQIPSDYKVQPGRAGEPFYVPMKP